MISLWCQRFTFRYIECSFIIIPFLNFTVLSKLVTSLKEAESLSSEQELGFLQNLLESKEINALVSVHSKVAKVVKDEKFAPIMSGSMQVGCFYRFHFMPAYQ